MVLLSHWWKRVTFLFSFYPQRAAEESFAEPRARRKTINNINKSVYDDKPDQFVAFCLLSSFFCLLSSSFFPSYSLKYTVLWQRKK